MLYILIWICICIYIYIYIFYARRAAPHQPIHQPVNPGSSKTEAQEASRRLPGGSQRLPGGSREAPRHPPNMIFRWVPFQSQKTQLALLGFLRFYAKTGPQMGATFFGNSLKSGLEAS